MNSIFNDITQLISIIVFAILAVQAVYLFIFAFAGRIIPPHFYPRINKLGKFVIYIPSYKEDSVIVDTARAALAIDYPVEKKHVVVIADSLKPETLETYDDKTMRLAVKFFPDFLKNKGFIGMIKFMWSFLPEFFMMITGGFPKLIILAEFAGNNEEEVNKQCLKLTEKILYARK